MSAALATTEAPVPPASATRRRLPMGPRYEACGGEAQQRPCPRAECRYYLEDPAPSLFGEDPDRPTCALDVAELGPSTCEQIGALFGVSKQAIQVVERLALARLAKRAPAFGLDGTAWASADGVDYPEEIEEASRGGGRKRRAEAAQAELFVAPPRDPRE